MVRSEVTFGWESPMHRDQCCPTAAAAPAAPATTPPATASGASTAARTLSKAWLHEWMRCGTGSLKCPF